LIRITEEPYDGPVGVGFVQELLEDLKERYEDGDDEGAGEADLEYLAEVTPAMVARPQGVFLVGWIDEEPVSCGALKPLDTDPAVGEVKRMYTRPAGRRRGFGRRILERLEEVARDLGYRRLQLETGSPQPEAVALYESHGWHGITPYGHYKDSPESVCFAKDLVPR
jgi:GNAT superfamily N-acetyltransferase